MKRLVKRTKGLIKGAPTAVLVSIGIHAAILLLAGGMVVFTVVKKMEQKFEPPPPVERKTVELKKPKVKVKKRARPKASQRISSRNIQGMSNIQLPETSRISEGLGGGVGGFEMMPDPADMSLFGGKSSLSIGNDFEGTFYALTLDRSGKRNSQSVGDEYYREIGRFLDSGWNPRSFSMYYRAPQKLYTTFFYIPMTASEFVPRSFGIPDEVYTLNWMAHYKGKFAAKESGTYRFWGRGENVCVIRVNGEVVLTGGHVLAAALMSDWRGSAEEHRKYWRGHGPMGVGDWFELEAGVPADFEIVFGDTGGAWTQCTVTIQKKGEIYPKNRDGAPILPVFRTAEIPQHLIDEITYSMIEGEADLTGGQLFNVY
ncbi:hypothetical protein [Tichowtungia aerotolerans]|uniref:PA14 domain-containing protein n=1 Tax=Tichowtungia aerotolerans TaxID=2697043 RepID=A0A6P1M9D9_9BACT|nr:hypothetical protein [Tichowtungia aerotolerans]QHI70517.1 hypothetical protein GT409_14075 [Tichowtungia aerotolerans]